MLQIHDGKMWSRRIRIAVRTCPKNWPRIWLAWCALIWS